VSHYITSWHVDELTDRVETISDLINLLEADRDQLKVMRTAGVELDASDIDGHIEFFAASREVAALFAGWPGRAAPDAAAAHVDGAE
jgi:hypothetical protein